MTHPQQPTINLSRRWLLIGVWSLAIAGLFAPMLAMARDQKIAKLSFIQHLFHEALVVHVDLSVLVWFLAIACMLWSLLANTSRPLIPYLEEAAQFCFIFGMAAIALSPLDPKGEAMMSNYIPVIHNPVFFLGLALILCGVGLMLVHLFTAANWNDELLKPLQFAIFTSGIIALVSLIAFVWSYHLMPPQIDGQQYYDMLFWGGGHVLQFTHTQLLMVAWISLAGIHGKWQYPLFSIGLVAIAVTPFAYLKYDITSGEFRQFFTWLMIIGNGLAPALLAIKLLPHLWHGRSRDAFYTSLLMSVILFLYGGILASMINGQNLIIPAHYHGSIVAITYGFMGIAYLLLPRFGYADVRNWRLAIWQPIVYGVGQIIHISGLAYSGGYGALRKTIASGSDAPFSLKAGLYVMEGGMGIAIIGGLMFVIVVWKAVRKTNSEQLAAG